MDTQTETNDWLTAEEATLSTNTGQTFEQLPSLKLMPNVITEMDIDASKPFQKWTDDSNVKKVTKAIIPVTVNGSKQVWWLNTKNPIYSEIIRALKNGQTHFKILQTGTQAQTKYVMVK